MYNTKNEKEREKTCKDAKVGVEILKNLVVCVASRHSSPRYLPQFRKISGLHFLQAPASQIQVVNQKTLIQWSIGLSLFCRPVKGNFEHMAATNGKKKKTWWSMQIILESVSVLLITVKKFWGHARCWACLVVPKIKFESYLKSSMPIINCV